MNYALAEQLPNMVVFFKIVELNGLQATASQLGMSRSAVSKKLSQLEAHLGERLIHRTTRRLSLTEYGEVFYSEAQALLGFLDRVDELKEKRAHVIQGELSVSCSTALGRRHLLPLLPRFNQLHPKVQLHLSLEDRRVDLIQERIDVAIRIGHMPDSSLVAQRLGVMRWVVVVSPAYVQQHGAPEHPEDLAAHQCLTYRNDHSHMNLWQWRDSQGQAHQQLLRSAISVNDADALVDMALQGAGVVLIDHSLVHQAIARGDLLELLTDYQLPEGLPIYAVYPSRKGLSNKTQAFLNFLFEEFSPRLNLLP